MTDSRQSLSTNKTCRALPTPDARRRSYMDAFWRTARLSPAVPPRATRSIRSRELLKEFRTRDSRRNLLGKLTCQLIGGAGRFPYVLFCVRGQQVLSVLFASYNVFSLRSAVDQRQSLRPRLRQEVIYPRRCVVVGKKTSLSEQFWLLLQVMLAPGGSVRGERANLKGLVNGCIEAKICNKICVGTLSPRSTQSTPLYRSLIAKVS